MSWARISCLAKDRLTRTFENRAQLKDPLRKGSTIVVSTLIL